MCSINSCNRRAYPAASDGQSLDGRDAGYDRRTINDKDTIYFQHGILIYDGIRGSVYNAIDPRYIANTYGVSLLGQGKGIPPMTFTMTGDFNSSWSDYLTTVNAAHSWNYVVDDYDMNGKRRAVVSALMPDAMEKVEFSTPPRYKHVYLTHRAQDTMTRAIGDVLIRTRHIPKESIETRNTRYLLDGTEITYKIFNALNPVFIRTLERITDKTEIAQLGYDNCSEVVSINLFTVNEVVGYGGMVVTGEADQDAYIAIIDGVALYGDPMFDDIAEKFYYYFFKEYIPRLPKDDKDYQQYVEKYPGKTDFTIITL
jgi:hypothetical protein